MSHAATNWAKEQTTGDSGAMSVLRVLADYANEKTGKCWPTQKRIARETELSSSSVKRKLRLLESLDLIARFDPKAHHRDSGKWKSASTYVLFNDRAIAEAKKRGWKPNNERNIVKTVAAGSPSYDRGGRAQVCRGSNWTTDDCAGQEPLLTTDRGSPLSHRTLTLEPIPLNSPLTPQIAAPKDHAAATNWESFVDAWPTPICEDAEAVRAKFEQISPRARATVIKATMAYACYCASSGCASMSPWSFIAERRWTIWMLQSDLRRDVDQHLA